MVQIIDENKPLSLSDRLVAGVGRASTQELPQILENMALKQRGIDVSGLRGYSRDVAIKEGMKNAMAIQAGRRTLPTQGNQPGLPQAQGVQQTQGIQPSQGTLPSTDRQGQVPVQQQRGKSFDIISPEQIEAVATRNATEKLNRGEITNLQNEIGLIQQQNANIAHYKAFQEETAAKAKMALEKVYPEATDEQRSIVGKKAEAYLQQGLSPAEVERRIAIDSKNLKNQIASIEKSLPPKRFYTRAKEAVLGTGRSEEKTRDSIRLKLKPLLDEGQFDTARLLLSKQGYAPEERETIISNLSEPTKKNLQGFVPIKKGAFHDDPSYRAFEPGTPEAQKFGENLQQTIQGDPATNLILLRKAYEDRGVDWRSFKDELDRLQTEDVFKPNDDQMKQIDFLDEPPLDRLDVLLHNFGFKGR